MSYVEELRKKRSAGMRSRDNTGSSGSLIILLIILFILGLSAILCVKSADAGPYLNSAHGDSSYGVKRSAAGFPGDYTKGLCAHCHEQHASIDGAEPAPDGGAPSGYGLFYDNYVSQTNGICFKCHTDLNSYQTGGSIVNRSYSYRAGGWTADTLNDILEAFSFSSPGSSHNLQDIDSQILGVAGLKTAAGAGWSLNDSLNPCNACHNPHIAQGDPLGAPDNAKSSGTRGWPVSRPSQQWGLWGDNAGEKMNSYTSSYQAPYRYNSNATYEPDGSTTWNGSNLTDFATFCTDCHNTTNTIYSTTLGRNLRTIDWNNEKHGKGNADTSLCGDNPYPSGTTGLGKVLSCTDCHEPHGSPNAFLIRKEVNSGVLGGTIGSFSTTNWHYLCDRCHNDDKEINPDCQEDHYFITHHSNEGCNSDRPYNPKMCGSCHGGGGGKASCTSSNAKKICTDCHFHGSSDANGRTF